MAQTAITHLLLRRLSLSKPHLKPHLSLKPFSSTTTTTQPNSIPSSQDPPKPSSLSARMSFVFDQIDAIENQRSQQDQTLQRIRAWRQSKTTPQQQQQQQQQPTNVINNFETFNTQQQNPEPESKPTNVINDNVDFNNSTESTESDSAESVMKKQKREVELVHPWAEWIELMGRLVQQNYFDHKRIDEDRMVKDLGFDVSGVVEDDDVGIDFSDFKTVQNACVNFGKDRFDIMRSLSRQDIQILVGYGCPSADKKVVFSAKLLRKHVHLDEGDVCSSCSLRSSCERAYLLTNKEDEARTIDIMRVLLTFGFDPVNGSVVNKSLLKQKYVKTVVRKLLHEVVKLSAVPIDPNLPPPVIKKPPPKVKQPPPPPKKRVGRDDIEMKKGDWLCPKCDFMNFAKNAVCLQCDAKRPKRQLLPGEWECPACNFLNYRRNMACFHCDCKRPPDEFVENQMQERQHGAKTRLEKTASRPEVSNAWNFDFDDNESDGADVAAFEYADSAVMGEDSPSDSQAHRGNFGGPEDHFNKARRVAGVPEREYSNIDSNRPGMGFDDFDDFDDVDSYELDTLNNNPVRKTYSNDFSEVEGFSESEDIRGSDDHLNAHHKTSSSSYNRPSKHKRQKASFSGSEDDELGFDSDEELSVHPNWKSSHVADSRHRSRGRGSTGPSRGLSFGSDEELGPNSDVDEDFGSRQRKGNKMGTARMDFRGRGSSNIEDGSFSDLESDDDVLHSQRNRSVGNKTEPGRRTNNLNGRGDYNFVRDTQFKSNGKMGDRRNSLNDDFDRSSRGSRGSDRGFRGNDYGGRRMNDRGGDLRNFKGPRGEGFGNQQRGSSYDHDVDMDASEFRNGRGFRGNDHGGRRMNDRGSDLRNFKGPRGEGFGNRQRGRSYDYDVDTDTGESRNSRGFRGNDRGGRGINDRGVALRNFEGPRREGFGNRQRGRSYDDGEFRNPRRVIKR